MANNLWNTLFLPALRPATRMEAVPSNAASGKFWKRGRGRGGIDYLSPAKWLLERHWDGEVLLPIGRAFRHSVL
jgi:hypothetical protein